jgi:hypothetical protein
MAVVVAVALDAPRASRPLPPLVGLAHLLDVASRSRVSLEGPAVALMPVAHLDVTGVVQEARVRLITTLPEGVLRADVVVARRHLFGTRYALLVVAARGSAADRALVLVGAPELALGAERRACLLALDPRDLGASIARLVDAASPAPEAVALRAAA